MKQLTAEDLMNPEFEPTFEQLDDLAQRAVREAIASRSKLTASGALKIETLQSKSMVTQVSVKEKISAQLKLIQEENKEVRFLARRP